MNKFQWRKLGLAVAVGSTMAWGSIHRAVAIDPADPSLNSFPATTIDHAPAEEIYTQPEWHRIAGTVDSVSLGEGFVTLKTDAHATPLRLLFSPHAVGELKPGDTITVQIAYSKALAGGMRAYDAPENPASLDKQAIGYREMTGMARNVDHEKGMFQLSVHAESLMLRLPAAAIHDLKDGDLIVVQLAFAKGKQTS